MNKSDKIYVAGHNGMVGSAIVRNLETKGFDNLVLRSRFELDLTNQKEVNDFFRSEIPDYVFLAAAKVGGIIANSELPADFIYENLAIETNVIDAAARYKCTKLLFLGSSCIYPKMAKQPIVEDQLLTGPLEPTNSAYAIAKIAGIKMCQSYHEQYGMDAISLMPTNLYGPNDNYDIRCSHVLPALLHKMHLGKTCGIGVNLYGDGSPRREFLHVDDLAEACYVAMEKYNDSEPINVGTGEDITIKELAELVADVIGYEGEIFWKGGLNGTPRKVLNVDKIKSLGWEPTVGLREGIEMAYRDYLHLNAT